MLGQKNIRSKDQITESFKDVQFRPIHPFPARMAPSIAWDSLRSCSQKPLKVLDPMTGSGTTAVIAKSLGHTFVGFDTDPLAVLIANAWCSEIDRDKLLRKAAEVLDKAIRHCSHVPLREAYPKHADDETRAFVRYWFDSYNRRQLTALSEIISRLRDPGLKTILWCAFSRLIITKKVGVSLAMDISHSRPHRVYDKAPATPFDKFLSAVEVIIKRLPFSENGRGSLDTTISLGDARQLPLQNRSVDIVITSPPYLNAIDYLRGHKLSLIWNGYTLKDLRQIRSTNVGAENSIRQNPYNNDDNQILAKMGAIEKLSPRIVGILKKYVHDMDSVIGEISRVLNIQGQAVLVVGDSTIKGSFIQNSRAITLLGRRHCLIPLSIKRRKLQDNRRYLPPPTSVAAGLQMQGRMREEVIMTFSRCA